MTTEAGSTPILVAAGLMTGPAVALGLGRFAYALVLPAMRADLGWSFTTAGTLNTANALGYLAGALLAAAVARRVGERRSFLLALAVTALALLASAATGDLVVLLVLRLVAGISGAVCLVVGAGLAAQAGRGAGPARATLLLSVYFTGSAVAIVVSGLLVPVVLSAGGWRGAWLLLGLLSLLALVAAVPAARAVPETVHPTVERGRTRLRPLAALLGCYLLFGAGYIAYMTFIVAALRDAGAGGTEVTVFWTVLGAAAVGAAFVSGRLLARTAPGTGLALVLLVLAVGAALPVLALGPVAALVSAVLFGASVLTVVTAITDAARRSLAAHRWTAAIAALTSAFALGQCVGPVLSGALSDGSAGIRAGLAVGAGLLLLAAAVAPLHDRLLPARPDAG